MKKSILFPLIFGVTSLFANSLVVRDANVTVIINAELKSLKKNQELQLEEGSTICFKGGEGKVIINQQRQLSADMNLSCISLVLKKEFDIVKWFKNQTQPIVMLFSDVKETTKSGMSREVDSTTGQVKQQSYTIPKDKKEMIIYMESLGMRPLTLYIKDSNGEEVRRLVSDSSKSMFRVGVESVKDGYSLVVVDRMDDVLLDVLLVDENSSK